MVANNYKEQDYISRTAQVYQLSGISDEERQVKLRALLSKAMAYYDDLPNTPTDVAVNAANTYYYDLQRMEFRIDEGLKIVKWLDDNSINKDIFEVIRPATQYLQKLQDRHLSIEAGMALLETADDLIFGQRNARTYVDTALGILNNQHITLLP